MQLCGTGRTTNSALHYSLNQVELTFTLQFGADFADISKSGRERARGEMLPPIVEDGRVRLSYRGLTASRCTTIEFNPRPPISIRIGRVREALPPHGKRPLLYDPRESSRRQASAIL
jgi:hypothetical protein